MIAVLVEGGTTETLLTTPLLRSLRAGAAGVHIVLVCPAGAAELADGLPAVDEVVPLRALDGELSPAGALTVWRQLRRRRLQAVLLCARSPWASLAAFLAGVPTRVGASGGVSALLLTDRSQTNSPEMPAATWLRMVLPLGIATQLHAPVYEPGPEARENAARLLYDHARSDGRLRIALAPGSGYAARASTAGGAGAMSRTWDPQRYALLANALAQRREAEVILLGTPEEQPLLDETMLDLGIRVVDFTGEHDLRLVAAVLAHCDAAIAADGPLLHLAAAVGTKVVGLFGPSDGRVRGPYGGDHRVIQALAPAAPDGDGPSDGAPEPVPPGRPFMDQIRVDDVLVAVDGVT